jgi:uncharacterized protein YbjT (DUF2867 family)
VVDALLSRGGASSWKIICITRDPTSAPARALAARDLTVARADANSRASLDAVLAAHAPVHGFFAVTNPFAARWTGGSAPKGDVALETLQGKNMVDACKAAGVAHFILTSVASAGDCDVDGAPVETFDAKWKVEKHLEASGLPFSILAPAGFFENMESPFAGLKQGVVPGLLQDTMVQMISTVDIGVFAAIAFENRDAWLGRRLEIAGDTTSAAKQAATMSALRGGEPWKVKVPPEWVFKLFIRASLPKRAPAPPSRPPPLHPHTKTHRCRRPSFPHARSQARGAPARLSPKKGHQGGR